MRSVQVPVAEVEGEGLPIRLEAEAVEVAQGHGLPISFLFRNSAATSA